MINIITKQCVSLPYWLSKRSVIARFSWLHPALPGTTNQTLHVVQRAPRSALAEVSKISLQAFLLFCVLVLSYCDNSDKKDVADPPDSLTITINDGQPVEYVGGQNSTDLVAMIRNSGASYVYLNSHSNPGKRTLFYFGSILNDGTWQAPYVEFYSPSIGSFDSSKPEDMSVTITEFGAVGGRFMGHFTATACHVSAQPDKCDLPENNVTVNAQFDIKLGSDSSDYSSGTPAENPLDVTKDAFDWYGADGTTFGETDFKKISVLRNKPYLLWMEGTNDDIGLYVYSDSKFSNVLCSSSVDTQGLEVCEITPGEYDDLYLQVVPEYGLKSSYHLTIADLASYEDEGDISHPLTLKEPPISYHGQVQSKSYYQANTTTGQTYTVAINGQNWEDKSEVTVFSKLGTEDKPLCRIFGDIRQCSFVADSSQAFIKVTSEVPWWPVPPGNTAPTGGSEFQLTVNKGGTVAVSEGSASNPIGISVTAPMSYTGSVGVGKSFYQLSVQTSHRYTIQVNPTEDERLLLHGYDDQDLSVEVCNGNLCRFSATKSTYYLVVDGTPSRDGASFELKVAYDDEEQAPPLSDGTKESPIPLPDLLNTPYVSSEVKDGFYKLTVDPNLTYTLSARNNEPFGFPPGISIRSDTVQISDSVFETTNASKSTFRPTSEFVYVDISGNDGGFELSLEEAAFSMQDEDVIVEGTAPLHMNGVTLSRSAYHFTPKPNTNYTIRLTPSILRPNSEKLALEAQEGNSKNVCFNRYEFGIVACNITTSSAASTMTIRVESKSKHGGRYELDIMENDN